MKETTGQHCLDAWITVNPMKVFRTWYFFVKRKVKFVGIFRVAKTKLKVFSNIVALKLQRKFSIPEGCDFYATNVERTEIRFSRVSNPWRSQTPCEGYNHPTAGNVELGCLQGYLWHAVRQLFQRIFYFIPNIYPPLQYGQGRTAQAKPVWDIIWRSFLSAQSDTKMWN